MGELTSESAREVAMAMDGAVEEAMEGDLTGLDLEGELPARSRARFAK